MLVVPSLSALLFNLLYVFHRITLQNLLIAFELTQMGIVFKVPLAGFNVENALSLHFDAAKEPTFKSQGRKKYDFTKPFLAIFLFYIRNYYNLQNSIAFRTKIIAKMKNSS